jgi:hypothetical protein
VSSICRSKNSRAAATAAVKVAAEQVDVVLLIGLGGGKEVEDEERNASIPGVLAVSFALIVPLLDAVGGVGALLDSEAAAVVLPTSSLESMGMKHLPWFLSSCSHSAESRRKRA